MAELPNLELEQKLLQQGYRLIAGIDEAGRGALAGPVYAAAVILAGDKPGLAARLEGVRDSKQMSAKERRDWAGRLPELCLAYGVGFATAAEIDQLGIAPATRLAAQRALDALQLKPDHLLLDYFRMPANPIPQTAIPKGDQLSLSIAAASVLAKTSRDEFMQGLAGQFPGYGLSQNKGYGTAAHLAAIKNLGPSEVHRHSFSPIKPRLI